MINSAYENLWPIIEIMRRIVCVWLLVLAISACTKGELSGHAFIVKGGGEVQPSAGRPVYLISAEDEPSLYYPAFQNAYDEAVESLLPLLLPICDAASDLVASEKSQTEQTIADTTAKNTIPDGGCETIRSEFEHLTHLDKAATAEYSESQERIQSRLMELVKQRYAVINQKAEQMRSDALANVSLRPGECDGFGECKLIAVNHSEYCIDRFKVHTFQNGIKLTTEEVVPKTRKSGDRTPIHNCGFPPNEIGPVQFVVGERLRSLGPDRETNPALRATKLRFGLRVLPDEFRIAQDTIFRTIPVKGESGRYENEKVDFVILAEALGPYPQDEEIASLSNTISRNQEAYSAERAQVSPSRVRAALETCESDSQVVKTAESKLRELGEIESGLRGCDETQVSGLASLAAQLKLLNSKYSTKLELPDFRGMVTARAMAQIIESLIGDHVRRVDTAITGEFLFEEIENGQYLLFSEYADNFNNGFWLKPITIKGPTKSDLNSNDLVPISFYDYLTWQSRDVCVNCTQKEFFESMLSRRGIVEAQREYDELNESIEKLKREIERRQGH